MIGPVEQRLSTRPGTPNFIGAATSGFTNDLDNLNLPHTKTFVMPSLHGMLLSIYSAFMSLITHHLYILISPRP